MPTYNHKSVHKLMPKQGEFVQSQTRYTLYSGAVRGGKTLALCYRALLLSQTSSEILIACHTYKMLTRVILPVLKQVLRSIPNELWVHNKADQQIVFDYGDRECILYLSHLQDLEAIQGMTLDHYMLDEATAGVSEDAFEMLNSRLSRPGATAAIATNPGTLSHWLYQFFFNAPDHLKDKRKIIFARTDDNIHLPEEYLGDLQDRPESWKRRYLEGRWGAVEGLIYGEFDRQAHVIDFEIDKGWEYFITIDWGYTNYFACLLIAIDGDGKVYVIDELYKSQVLTKDLMPMVASLMEGYGVEYMICDNNDINSANMFREGLDVGMHMADKRPGSVKRGLNAVRDKIHIYADGESRLFIKPKCAHLVGEIESYMNKQAPDGAFIEEPVKKNDHGLDALRYFVTMIKR